MKKIIGILFLAAIAFAGKGQTTAQIKKELEATKDPFGYVRAIKKKYFIDTITVMSSTNFIGISDSIAYKGKIGKVYGPFPGQNILVKVLAKIPNTFYHVNHIVLDTSVFQKKFADSMATVIINKIKTGQSDFKTQAALYSADISSAVKGGDLGWFIRGALLPQLDKELGKRKKGDIFKVWSSSGLHIIKIADNPKQDDGFALMLRVIL